MKTLALVIGNNDYLVESSKLENAVNDAKAIKEVFEKLNYDVIYKENSTAEEDASLLLEFKDRLETYDASIFYFAGHGFQFKGENYLASISCPVEQPNEQICGRTCIRMAEITDIIKDAPTKVNIIIIDACRKSFERGGSTSFAQINAPEGTIIAFSTSPGEGAKDGGMEGHSMYTGVLLKYIGRESLLVEDLFKKVRKTLYTLSGGAQTSWEHTSLVGDFYFNAGQLVHSVDIPYDESVVKDRTYISKGDDIDVIILDLKACDWHKQNPAITRLKRILPSSIDKNKQFIIGRNILQSSSYAHESINFMEKLGSNLAKYTTKGENHILNGILYEIYFDSNGDFRRGKLKTYNIDKVFELRHFPEFEQSFIFINKALEPFRNDLYYIPTKDDSMIDIDVLAEEGIVDLFGEKKEVQSIKTIVVNGKDITKSINMLCPPVVNPLYLKKKLVEFLVAPIELINVNENITLKNLTFAAMPGDEFEWDI